MEARLALRFTLSQKVTVAIPPSDHRLYDLALDVAQDFRNCTYLLTTATASRYDANGDAHGYIRA